MVADLFTVAGEGRRSEYQTTHVMVSRVTVTGIDEEERIQIL
jgi:hypothetical protein